MKNHELLMIGAAVAIYMEIRQPGTITGWLSRAGINVASPLGTAPAGTRTLDGCPPPTEQELAASLGTTVYAIRTALERTGKRCPADLTLNDFQGVEQVPSVVIVNGTPSYPSTSGPPATWNNPTGGSGTWGGLTDSEIQAAFLAAAGGDPVLAQRMWEEQHAAEVAARGY